MTTARLCNGERGRPGFLATAPAAADRVAADVATDADVAAGGLTTDVDVAVVTVTAKMGTMRADTTADDVARKNSTKKREMHTATAFGALACVATRIYEMIFLSTVMWWEKRKMEHEEEKFREKER